jgi:hypothetical protein
MFKDIAQWTAISPTAVEGKCLAEATGARKWNLSADGAEDV